MPAIQIRRLTIGDEEKVRQAAHLYDTPKVDEEGARACLADPHAYLLVAYLEGVPVGFARAFALARPDTPRRQLFLYEIGVDEPYRRRGVGRTLVRELLRIC